MNNLYRSTLLSIMAAGFASGATYRFTLPMDAVVDGQELKAGEYRVDVNETSAVIRGGKKSIETKVKPEATARKYDATSVKYNQVAGKYTLMEIHVGGKKLNLVFESAKPVSGGD